MKNALLAGMCAALLFSLARPLSAQITIASDPNDRLYTDLRMWEDRGLLPALPQLRPYPIQLLQKLLSDVEDKGTPDDAARARQYYADFDGKINIHIGGGILARTDLKSGYGEFTFGGPLQGTIHPLVTYSGWLAGVANNASQNSVLPENGRSTVDYITDASVRAIGSTGLIPRVSSFSAAAFGSDNFYFQAGDIRGSWGPFWGDNVVLSPLSPQSGQFSAVFRGERFTASESVMAISGVTSAGTGGPFPSKFVALHGLDLYPFPWLTLGIFESVVWGGRFEALYLLPFAVHYYTQGFVGFPDNSFIGVNASVHLPESVRLDLLAYFDDMSFNDLIRFVFNTKLKFALQTGATWTPNLPLLSSLSFEALMVTPYTYSHTNDSGDAPGEVNYLDYTNGGASMGPSLQPDSLRLQLSALIRPLPLLDVKPFGRLILHGNASSNAPFPDPNNGTVFDNGYYGGQEAFNTFRFLSQGTIEKTIQLGFDGSAYLPTAYGRLKFTLGYTFEYVLDPLDNTGQPAGGNQLDNYLAIGASYLY